MSWICVRFCTNNLYEYIDPIASPYEAFFSGAGTGAKWTFSSSAKNILKEYLIKSAVILFPPMILTAGSSENHQQFVTELPIFVELAKSGTSFPSPGVYLFSGTKSVFF